MMWLFLFAEARSEARDQCSRGIVANVGSSRTYDLSRELTRRCPIERESKSNRTRFFREILLPQPQAVNSYGVFRAA